MIRVRFLILIAALAALQGCSLFKPTTEHPSLSVADRQAYLNRASHWNLSGRVAIIANKESETANISWQKQGEQVELRIYGSLGITYATLSYDSKAAHIELPDDQQAYGTDPEALLWETTGWQIPVKELELWILGIANKDEKTSLNAQGYIERISHQSWQIRFKQYDVFNGLTMPKRIDATHPQVKLKFSIYDWEVNAL